MPNILVSSSDQKQPPKMQENLKKHPEQPNNQEQKTTSENSDEKPSPSEFFQEFYSSVTLHGFRFLFEGNPIRRLIWFVITTAVFLFCFVMFYGLFMDFLVRKTTTAIDKRIQEKDIPFPTVTICPINAQSKQKLNSLPINIFSMKDFIDTAATVLTHAGDVNITEDDEFFFQYVNDMGAETYTDFLKLYQVTYKDIMETEAANSLVFDYYGHKCIFYGEACEEGAIVDDKIWDGADSQVLCMQFNYFDPRQSPYVIGKAKSYFDGFNIFFDLGEVFYSWSDFKKGMVVTIDNHGDDQSLMSSSEYIFLKPGEMTTLKLTETEIIRLPAPYDTQCAEKELPMIDPNRRYTKGLCVMNCVLERLYQQCGCIAEHYKRLVQNTDIPICTLRETRCFILRKWQLLVEDDEYVLTCYNSCPDECQHHSYTVKKTSASLGTEEIYERARHMVPKFENKTIDDIEKYYQRHVLGLHVSFVDNVVKSEKAHPVVTLISLIANVGGAVGLGLGFSFITCFEFIFFIYDFIKLKILQQKRKRKTGPDNNNNSEEA